MKQSDPVVSKSIYSYKLVVAKYKENIDWIKHLDKTNVIIYDKSDTPIENSIARKNIGREVETFIYYILQNYDNLADYTIFVQGNPFDHMSNINAQNFQSELDRLLNEKPDTKPLFCSLHNEHHTVYTGLKVKEYYEFLFDESCPEITQFAAGTQYIIPKHQILKHPKSFYGFLQSMLLNTSILDFHTDYNNNNNLFDKYRMCGWTFERLMYRIFSNSKINQELYKPRYLVTGGAGFIGSNLVKKLINDSNVVIVDNLCTGDISNIIKETTFFIQGDILDKYSLYRVGYIDGIFHMAAMSKVAPSLGDPNMVEFCNEQNINGTVCVLKYAASFNPPIKVIYSASSTCYGLNNIPNTETQLPDCQTPYALSKYCGELQCELFSRLFRVPTVRLRYFMVFGNNEPSNGPYAVVSGIFLKKKQNDEPLLIHGDGNQTRDFVHVEDICQANILSMKSNLINETINVGTGTMVSIKELANLISDNQIHVESRSVDLKHTLADTSKIESLLGWKPTKKIQDYIIEKSRELRIA